MIELKVCHVCNESLNTDQFPKNRKAKDGLYHKCKACTKLYREANKQKIKECRQKYYKNNTLFVKNKVKKYAENNSEKVKIKNNLDYRKRNRQTMLWDAKRRSKQKNVPFNLTVDDVVIPEFCPILGIPIIVGGQIGPSANSPSLDRKVPEMGYVKGNVHVVSWRANRIKSDSTINELELILKYMRAE
jgi:hypothetical protein